MNNKRTITILIIALIIGAVIYVYRSSVVSKQGIPPTKSSDEILKNNQTNSENVETEIKAETDFSSESSTELSLKMSDLPNLADVENLSEEDVHETPEIIIRGGMRIGELIEAAQNDPSKREATLLFLKGCAESDDLVPAIRALCWKKVLSHTPRWNIFIPLSDANVPEEIKNLSSEIP